MKKQLNVTNVTMKFYHGALKTQCKIYCTGWMISGKFPLHNQPNTGTIPW